MPLYKEDNFRRFHFLVVLLSNYTCQIHILFHQFLKPSYEWGIINMYHPIIISL